ncbi:lectin like domain-containing protein [Methanogenium cariaci]|uniref:lectin like domain-containing protein n=1 Tax=Methanogenium cariaci TaxID=2197 RepID=UPI00078558A2|nr:lectin like domain-containing protein [Methanogenium cariaci]
MSLDYAVLFTGVPADEEKRIYQYDPLGATMEIGTGTDTTAYAANVFTADNYEELTDVSFYTPPEPGGTDYTVAIFANFTTPPGDAAPVAWASGTSALPGYHTISLPKTVPLVPGEEFSVVMKVTTPPTFNYPITIETPIDGYSSKATAGLGESYVSEDGETWVDLTTIYPDTNACIKRSRIPPSLSCHVIIRPFRRQWTPQCLVTPSLWKRAPTRRNSRSTNQ